MLWVLQGTLLKDNLPEKDEPLLFSTIQELRPDIPGNTMVPEREIRREPQNSSIRVPRFHSGGGILNHTGGTILTVV